VPLPLPTSCCAAGYEQCQSKLLRLLERLVYLREITPDYTYYGIASPWLQTKVLRTLQYFPLPEGTAAQKQLHDVLQAIFNGEEWFQLQRPSLGLS
jgi:AP-2 complex subunit alpha